MQTKTEILHMGIWYLHIILSPACKYICMFGALWALFMVNLCHMFKWLKFSLICVAFYRWNFTNRHYSCLENTHFFVYLSSVHVKWIIYLYMLIYILVGVQEHCQHNSKHPNHWHHYPNPHRKPSYLNASSFDPQPPPITQILPSLLQRAWKSKNI